MPIRRREVELTVERPLRPDLPSAGTVKLSAKFDLPPDGSGPGHSELARALDDLQADLDGIVGPLLAATPIGRPERDLTELVETYRPRQRELIDLLLGEGELTAGEHARLVEYLGAPPAPAEPPAPPPERKLDAPIAAVPIVAARADEGARPVPELLRLYRIDSLRQAGAVRARREISFAEYMALKRHFQDAEASGERRATPGNP
ncbi:MAG TPA: hypothetical protein VEE86_02480 [Thermoplasmata archaeon]|nr:hypothetical protein [Thermoplasmata archaeon]